MSAVISVPVPFSPVNHPENILFSDVGSGGREPSFSPEITFTFVYSVSLAMNVTVNTSLSVNTGTNSVSEVTSYGKATTSEVPFRAHPTNVLPSGASGSVSGAVMLVLYSTSLISSNVVVASVSS